LLCAPFTGSMQTTLRALVVDDSEDDAALVVDALRRDGRVVVAARVQDAQSMRAALSRETWDVVLSEWSLRHCSALEALQILRASRIDIPVFVVSHRPTEEVARDAVRSGARAFVPKAELARLLPLVEHEGIGPRVRADELMRRTEADRFFHLASDLLSVVGYDGQFRRVNAAWGALGWTEEELMARPFADFVHPDERAASDERRAKLVAGGSGALAWETRFRCKNGGYRNLQFSAMPFDAEKVVYTVARDVTEAIAAQEALRKSQARMARLAESGVIGVAIIDVHGNVHEANAAYCELLACTPDDVAAGKVRWVELIAPEFAEAIRVALAELATRAVARPFEVALIRRDGTRRSVLVGVAMLEHPECIAFVTDLTERKRAEESLKRSEHLLRHAQKMEAIGQLAAGIAHEMNTPAQYVSDNIVFLRRAFEGSVAALGKIAEILRGADGAALGEEQTKEIAGCLRGAKVDFLVKQVPRALEQSAEGMRRVCAIVSAMKEFSHPSSSESAPVDLRGLIEATLTVSTNEWKYFADVETDFDASMPPVPCLRDELGQVVLNLVVNAAHAIRDATRGDQAGKGTITVSTRREGGWAEIRVADTGTGVPAAIRERIFDPFFTTKAVGEGTGQGLAIAYSIVVDKHGGQITFDTVEGKGTTFLVRIPYHAPRTRLTRPVPALGAP
jgi:two-component system, NtrC family, sensor kinase